MNMESKKKDIEAHSGDWLLKYDDSERRLDWARRILNKYPSYVPLFNRSAQPFEKVEILLSDIQELHVIVDINRPR